jgi:Tfp pilus assembly protein PilO
LFSKLISGLSPKERKVLIFAAIIAVAAIFDRLLVAPSLSQLRVIDGKITEQQQVIEQNMRFLTRRDSIIKEAAVYKDFYTKSVQTEEVVIADVLKKVESLATKSDITLVKVFLDGQDKQKDYLKYFVTLDCSGKFENITNFMYAFNSSPELLKVEKMNLLANPRDAEKIQATITISKMIMGADPTVEAGSLVKSSKQEPEAAAPAATPQQ